MYGVVLALLTVRYYAVHTKVYFHKLFFHRVLLRTLSKGINLELLLLGI
jgi:hypothetical protein